MDNNPFDSEFFNNPQFQEHMRNLFMQNPSAFAAIQPQQNNSNVPTTQNYSTYDNVPNTQETEYNVTTPNQGSSNVVISAEEDEEVNAHQPIFPPPYPLHSTQPSPSEPTGKRNWTKREEEALIASYMEHCTDQTIGTNQKAAALWRKVAASYNAARESRPLELHKRTLAMMESHWRRMCADIMKWVGCVEEAKRNIRSGMSDQDAIRNAHLIYHHTYNKNFTHEHAWTVLEAYPKWRSRVERYLPGKGKKCNVPTDSDSSGKRVRVDDDEEETNAPTDGGDGNSVSGGIPRPDGVKRAKAARREGKKMASSGSDEVGLSLAEKIQVSAECREKHISVQMEKLELERAKEKRREREMKNNTLMALLNKTTPLSEREEKLKDRLMSEVYGD